MQISLDQALNLASQDTEVWEILRKRPSKLFIEDVPSRSPEYDSQFNDFFREEILPKLKREGTDKITYSAFPSMGCASCKVAAYGLGATIIALGAAGIATLSTGSAIVIQLAAFAGVSQTAALAFIASLAASLAGGIVSIVDSICGWTGAC